MTTLTHFYDVMSFDNCLRFPAMMKISTFSPNIADNRFISGLILKIEGLKIHCHKIDVYLFPRMKYNSVIYCDTRYAWMPPSWILPVNYGTALYFNEITVVSSIVCLFDEWFDFIIWDIRKINKTMTFHIFFYWWHILYDNKTTNLTLQKALTLAHDLR